MHRTHGEKCSVRFLGLSWQPAAWHMRQATRLMTAVAAQRLGQRERQWQRQRRVCLLWAGRGQSDCFPGISSGSDSDWDWASPRQLVSIVWVCACVKTSACISCTLTHIHTQAAAPNAAALPLHKRSALSSGMVELSNSQPLALVSFDGSQSSRRHWSRTSAHNGHLIGRCCPLCRHFVAGNPASQASLASSYPLTVALLGSWFLVPCTGSSRKCLWVWSPLTVTVNVVLVLSLSLFLFIKRTKFQFQLLQKECWLGSY